jgi:hypothetical protein
VAAFLEHRDCRAQELTSAYAFACSGSIPRTRASDRTEQPIGSRRLDPASLRNSRDARRGAQGVAFAVVMGKRIRSVAICAGLATLIGVHAARAAGGFSPPAFSPGHWTGKVTETGNFVVGDIAGTVSGSWTFSFRISRRGTVTGGSITGRDGIAASGPTDSVVGSNTGTIPLQGDSAHVIGIGTLHGHVEVAGFPPVDGDVPGRTYLDPVQARCGVVSGDAGSVARLFQRAAGAAITPSATFVARRSGSAHVRQGDVDKKRNDAFAALNSFLKRHRHSSLFLERAANEVKALNAIVASADACGSPPKGFEHGVTGNRTIGPKVLQMLHLAESNPTPYDMNALMFPLEAALEVGHAEFAQRLEDAIEAKISATAPTSANKAELEGIFQEAQLYGLSGLAAAASAQLARIP